MKSGKVLRELSFPRVFGGVSKESVYEIPEAIISEYPSVLRLEHHLVLSRAVYNACLACEENAESVDLETIQLLLANLELRIESILTDKRHVHGQTFVSCLHGEDGELESRELEILTRETTRKRYSVICLVPKQIKVKFDSEPSDASDSDLPF